jgi:hypothetical protein
MRHRYSKGASFEGVVRQFLEQYFPKNLDISSGFVIDSNDKVSNQIDIIVSDRFKTPIFYQDESIRVVPVECVYSVIEVKSDLDSKELQKCFQNMASVRSLEKKAYSRDPPYDEFSPALYNTCWDIWPINYYVFAIDSIDLNTLASAMEKKFAKDMAPLHSRIDTICVLEKGVICNEYQNGQWDALPGHGSRLTCIPTLDALLLFYTLIGSHLFRAQLPFFQFHDYVAKVHARLKFQLPKGRRRQNPSTKGKVKKKSK